MMRLRPCLPAPRPRSAASSATLGRVLLALLLLAGIAPASPAQAQRTRPDTTRDESGFNVRVVEESRGGRAARAQTPAPPAGADDADVPEPPEPPDLDTDPSSNDLVRFGEDITIPANKVVEGDVVAMGGDVTVLGRVKGDVVSIGGAVEVKGNGVIEGDAVSLGGGVTTTDSASVGGSNVSIGTRFGQGWPMLPAFGMFGAIGFGAWLVGTIVKLALSFFFAWLAMLLWKDGILRAARVLRTQFGKSFLWGLLIFAGLLLAIPVGVVALVILGTIAIVILCITIIGIPLAILLVIGLVLAVIGLVAGVVFAIFLGHVIGVMYLGQRILGASEGRERNPLAAIAVGLAVLAALGLAGKLAGFVGFLMLHPLSIAFGVAAGALSFILTTAGLGALWSSLGSEGRIFKIRLGTYNWGRSKQAPEPAAAGASATGSPSGVPPGGAAPPVPPPGGGTSDAP